MSREIREIIKSDDFKDQVKYKTVFGEFSRKTIDETAFSPEKKSGETRKWDFSEKPAFCIYDVTLSNPEYFNTAAIFKNLINADPGNKGNQGFGLLLLHDKSINSKLVNVGPSVPSRIWERISDSISSAEPDRWFQGKNDKGTYYDFILNRNKAHQEHLPSEKVDSQFLAELIRAL